MEKKKKKHWHNLSLQDHHRHNVSTGSKTIYSMSAAQWQRIQCEHVTLFRFLKRNADDWRWWSRSHYNTQFILGYTVYCNPFLRVELINNQCFSVWLTAQWVLCRVMWYLPLQAGNDLTAERLEPNQTNLSAAVITSFSSVADSHYCVNW